MNAIYWIFMVLSTLVSVYTIVCFIRIFLTWMPQANNSKFGRILANICDPYLQVFRRFSVFRTSQIDFTPIIALGILFIASSVLMNIAVMQRLLIGSFFATVIQVIWSFISTFLNFLVIIMVIRFIFSFMKQSNTSSFWYTVDTFLNPIIYKISMFFTGKKVVSYSLSIGIAAVTLFIANLLAGLFMQFIINLLKSMPF